MELEKAEAKSKRREAVQDIGEAISPVTFAMNQIGDALKSKFGHKVGVLHGETPAEKRGVALKDFSDQGKVYDATKDAEEHRKEGLYGRRQRLKAAMAKNRDEQHRKLVSASGQRDDYVIMQERMGKIIEGRTEMHQRVKDRLSGRAAWHTHLVRQSRSNRAAKRQRLVDSGSAMVAEAHSPDFPFRATVGPKNVYNQARADVTREHGIWRAANATLGEEQLHTEFQDTFQRRQALPDGAHTRAFIRMDNAKSRIELLAAVLKFRDGTGKLLAVSATDRNAYMEGAGELVELKKRQVETQEKASFAAKLVMKKKIRLKKEEVKELKAKWRISRREARRMQRLLTAYDEKKSLDFLKVYHHAPTVCHALPKQCNPLTLCFCFPVQDGSRKGGASEAASLAQVYCLGYTGRVRGWRRDGRHCW